MVANDRRVTAFVLSMLKTNAKVRRSDLERGENAVGSRWSWAKRRNISMDVVHAQYTRGKDAAKMATFAKAISWGRVHGVLTTTTSFSSLYFVFIIMAEDIQNLLIICAVWLHNDPLEISEKLDLLNT